MPFLDLERFLAESIESVLAQTYADWELLLVDDGSTDGSAAIARAYAAREPARIRCLAHENRANRGASASRNLAIEHANGEFIALLDGDDVWVPHKLEEQIALLKAHPEAGALYGRTLLWYSWTGAARDRRRDRLQRLGVPADTLLPAPSLLLRTLRLKANVPATCSILIRREAVAAVGGFEEEFRHIYTDQAFYAKLLLVTPVYVADRCWDRYRQHATSSVFTAMGAGEYHPALPHPARQTFLQWFERYLIARGETDTAVWRVLQRQLWLYRHRRLYTALKIVENLPDRIAGTFWEVGVPFAFRVGRRTLPAPLRDWVWRRWLSHRM